MADAAPPMPPAGWAFFPPLQRQLADAVPATLRPTFVSSLATRVVPTSLGTMSHLADGAAPAGAIGVDEAALGPAQRVVTSELGLRHPPGGASAGHGDVDLEVEDAGQPAPTAETHHAASGADTAAVADADSGAFAEGGSGSPPASETGLVSEAGNSGSASTRPGESRPSGRVPSPVQRQVGLGAPLRIETVQRRAPGAGPARSMPVRGAEITADRAEGPPPAATSSAPALAATSSAPPPVAATPAPPPVAATPTQARRPEAPFTVHSLTERPAPTVDADSPARGDVVPQAVAGTAVRPIPQRHEGSISPSEAMSQTSGHGSDSRASVQRQRGLGAPLAPPAGQRAPAPPAISDEGHAPADPNASRGANTATTAAAATVGEAPGRSWPPQPLRSVPLVAARTITPSLDASPLGPAHDTPRRGTVVVARAIRPDAPVQPVAADTGASPRTGAPTASRRTRSHAPTTGGGDPGFVFATADVPAAIADITPAGDRFRPQPAAAASVSRSTGTLAQAGASTAVTAERPHLATPTVQRAFGLPSVPSAPRIPSAPAMGSIPSLPSVPNLPSMPDRPDIPSADELRERAGEAVPDIAERLPGGAEAVRTASETLTRAGQTLAPDGGGLGSTAAGSDNVEQLVRRLYVPLVRRIKAELLLDRERRGIRIDGI